MCEEVGRAREGRRAAPRIAEGAAVDPIILAPVDEVTVTTLVDNTYDGLLVSAEGVGRPGFDAGMVAAPQFDGGRNMTGLLAEHGYSALVTVRRDSTRSTVLFDTGISPDGIAINAERLGIDFQDVQGVVLSHGHFDHAGGFPGITRLRRTAGLPLTVHPAVWTQRRIAVPGKEPLELPTLSSGALQREGFEVIERREPSLLVNGCILITGEVDRTTDFEQGMPPSHQALGPNGWQHDAPVIDDQALVMNLRGKGLVVITGCGHSGVVNIVRHAMRLTAVNQLEAVIGGFHLNGPAFEPIIGVTVMALTEMAPELIVPGHCTGWRAQHALASALPQAWTQSSAGSSYHLRAA